jgi:AcrR family transcriptional regulator
MDHVINTVKRMIKPPRRKPRPARRPREVPEDTRARILDAAERLFAERGVDAVSVRSVLKEAGVNVALAHYHFGSREGLIEELLRTRVTAHEGTLIQAVEVVDARGEESSLEDVLRAYFAPFARMIIEKPTLGKLLAQLQFSANPEVRERGREAMRPVLGRIGAAIVKRLPGSVTPGQVLLRVYLAISAPFYFSAQWDVVMRSAQKRVSGQPPGAGELTEELVAFCAAGLRAGGAEARGSAR